MLELGTRRGGDRMLIGWASVVGCSSEVEKWYGIVDDVRGLG